MNLARQIAFDSQEDKDNSTQQADTEQGIILCFPAEGTKLKKARGMTDTPTIMMRFQKGAWLRSKYIISAPRLHTIILSK